MASITVTDKKSFLSTCKDECVCKCCNYNLKKEEPCNGKCRAEFCEENCGCCCSERPCAEEKGKCVCIFNLKNNCCQSIKKTDSCICHDGKDCLWTSDECGDKCVCNFNDVENRSVTTSSGKIESTCKLNESKCDCFCCSAFNKTTKCSCKLIENNDNCRCFLEAASDKNECCCKLSENKEDCKCCLNDTSDKIQCTCKLNESNDDCKCSLATAFSKRGCSCQLNENKEDSKRCLTTASDEMECTCNVNESKGGCKCCVAFDKRKCPCKLVGSNDDYKCCLIAASHKSELKCVCCNKKDCTCNKEKCDDDGCSSITKCLCKIEICGCNTSQDQGNTNSCNDYLCSERTDSCKCYTMSEEEEFVCECHHRHIRTVC